MYNTIFGTGEVIFSLAVVSPGGGSEEDENWWPSGQISGPWTPEPQVSSHVTPPIQLVTYIVACHLIQAYPVIKLKSDWLLLCD